MSVHNDLRNAITVSTRTLQRCQTTLQDANTLIRLLHVYANPNTRPFAEGKNTLGVALLAHNLDVYKVLRDIGALLGGK